MRRKRQCIYQKLSVRIQSCKIQLFQHKKEKGKGKIKMMQSQKWKMLLRKQYKFVKSLRIASIVLEIKINFVKMI